MRAETHSVIHGVRDGGSDPATARDIRDALTLTYPDLVFTGWTAAALHGASYTDGHPVEIWLPSPRTRQGVVIRAGVLSTEDIELVLRRRATSGVRTAVDIARHTAGDEAIAGLDQCLRIDRYGSAVTTKQAVRVYLDTHPGLHGGRRARAVLAESSQGADSPWETYTRLTVHRSGLTLFEPQAPVGSTGYHADLGSTTYRIAIEYDGAYHRSVAQQRRDIKRWNAITGQRWAIIRVTSTTLTSDRETFLARIESQLRSRGWRGPSPISPHLNLPASATAPPNSTPVLAVSADESQVNVAEKA